MLLWQEVRPMEANGEQDAAENLGAEGLEQGDFDSSTVNNSKLSAAACVYWPPCGTS